MNEKCKKNEAKILQHRWDEELSSHLAECENCKEFAKFAENVQFIMDEKIREINVPSNLDLAIKSALAENLKTKNWEFLGLSWKKIIPFAVAAGLLIATSAVFIGIYQSKTYNLADLESCDDFSSTAQNQTVLSEINELERFDIEDELFILSADFMIYGEFLKYSLDLVEESEI